MKNILLLSIAIIAFSCHNGQKKSVNEISSEQLVEITKVTVNISGMHCENCVASVEKGINELDGIQSVLVSLSDSNAVVSYDKAKLEYGEIEEAIVKRGYEVK